MGSNKEKKDYCDAEDQKKVVEKMSECDTNAKTDKEKSECYSKVIKEDDGCMSS
jgi:hypothetical protein